jgi:hypothetical protein
MHVRTPCNVQERQKTDKIHIYANKEAKIKKEDKNHVAIVFTTSYLQLIISIYKLSLQHVHVM